MNIIVDIGNSRAKVVVMSGDRVQAEYVSDRCDDVWLRDIVESHMELRFGIVSSTREDAGQICSLMEQWLERVIHFKPSTTPVPLGNDYLTPETLGADRLAAAVGASALYPDSDLMIVDFGTAITVDYVVGGAFKGGNISPGVNMRFRAMHDYTRRLPLCSPTDTVLEYGRNTLEALEQGVMQGITNEIKGYISSFLEGNAKKCIIFTGGDAKYFVMRIKNAIFAHCEPLVIVGLNTILKYNAEIK